MQTQRNCLTSFLKPKPNNGENAGFLKYEVDENGHRRSSSWRSYPSQSFCVSSEVDIDSSLSHDYDSNNQPSKNHRRMPLHDVSNNVQQFKINVTPDDTSQNRRSIYDHQDISKSVKDKTPKSLLRKPLQNKRCSTKLSPDNDNDKKIQWDPSIPNLYSKKCYRVFDQQSLFPRRKRVDEIFQSEITFSNNNDKSTMSRNVRRNPVTLPDTQQQVSFVSNSSSGTSSGRSDATSFCTVSTEWNSKDSTEISEQIAECVRDVLDQTMAAPAPDVKGVHHKTGEKSVSSNNPYENTADVTYNTNVTAEIAECVADINDQTMASGFDLQYKHKYNPCRVAEPNGLPSTFKNAADITCNTDVTAEIAECVADINDQTMASGCDVKFKKKFELADGIEQLSPFNLELTKSNISDKSSPFSSAFNVSSNYHSSIPEHRASLSSRPKNYLQFDPSENEKYNISTQKRNGNCDKLSNKDFNSMAHVRVFPQQSLVARSKRLDQIFQSDITGTKLRTSPVTSPDGRNLYKSSFTSSRKSLETSCEDNTGISEQIAECVQDVLDQTTSESFKNMIVAQKVQTSRSIYELFEDDVTYNTNVTTEIVECVADINDQTMPSGCDWKLRNQSSSKQNMGLLLSQSVRPKSQSLLKMNTINSKGSTEQEMQHIQPSSVSSVSSSCACFNDTSPSVLIKKGASLMKSENYMESINIFKRALQIRQRKLGCDHPLVAKIHSNLGVVYLNMKSYEEALESFQKALYSHNNALKLAMGNGNPCDSTIVKKFDLEIAAMLCNVGSICLDWIEAENAAIGLNQKLLLSEKAEHAFNRALAIQMHHLDLGSSHVNETKEMCQEASSIHSHIREELQMQDIKNQSKTQGIQANVPQHTLNRRILSSHRIERLDELNTQEERCFISYHDDTISCPYDEHTMMEFPSDEISATGQNPHNHHSTLSLFSRNRACLGEIIDSDVEKIQSVTISLDDNYRDASSATSKVNMFEFSKTVKSVNTEESERCKYSSSNQSPDGFHDLTRSELIQISTQHQENFDCSGECVFPLEHGTMAKQNICEDILLSKPELNVDEIHDIAQQYLKDGNLEKSLSMFQLVLRVHTSKHGELHQTIGSTLHNIGIVFLRSEKYDDALASFQRAARIRKGSIGRDHADVAVSLVKAGIAQLLLQKFDDALISFHEALSIRRKALGHLHPSTARIYNNIGCAHVEFHEMREARRAFEAALDVQRNALCYEPDSRQLLFGTATTLCNLAHLYTNRAMDKKASLFLKEAVELQQRVIGASHHTVLSTLDALADSYSKIGDNANALKCYKDILTRLQDKEKGDNQRSHRNNRALAIVHYKMSRIYRKQNDLQAALQNLSESWSFVNGLGAEELLQRIKKEIDEVEEAVKNTSMHWV